MTESSPTVQLRVFSQLPEPHAVIALEPLLAHLTVGHVKQQIQDRLPSRPSFDHQRLIYLGRPLVRDTDTLSAVFGDDVLRQGGLHTLHLVIREPVTRDDLAQTTRTPMPIPSIVSPPPANVEAIQRPASASAPPHPTLVPQTPFGVNQLQNVQDMGNGGHAQQQLLQTQALQWHMEQLNQQAGRPNHIAIHVGGPVPQGAAVAVPPHVQHMQQIQMQQLHMWQVQQQRQATERARQHALQAMGPQHHNAHLIPGNGVATARAPSPAQRVNLPMDHFQAHARHLEQIAQAARAARGAGEAPAGVEQPLVQIHAGSDLQGQQEAESTSDQAQSITQQGVGPNGERWTMTVNTTELPFPPQQGLPNFSQQPIQNPFATSLMPTGFTFHPTAPQLPPMGRTASFPGWLGPAHAIDRMRSLQNDLSTLRRTVRASVSRPRSIMHAVQSIVRQRNHMQGLVNAVMAHGPPTGHTGLSTHDISILQSLHDQFRAEEQIVMSILQPTTNANPPENVEQEPTNTLSNPPTSSPAVPHPESSNDVVAYLLSSPTGPHSIIYTPHGTFTTVASSTESTAATTIDQANPPANPPHDTNTAQQPAPAVVQQPLQQQVILRAAQPQAPDDNALVVALTPFLRTLWFSIRLCAFFWFFLGMGSTSTNRIIFMMAISALYHAFQVGLFRDQIDWARRYWEGLIGVPEPGPRDVPEAGLIDVPEAGPRDVAAGQTGAVQRRLQRGTPRPEDAAQRILEETRRRNRGWVRAGLREVERAVALFVASLYPGVGERHVAERERVRRETDERDRAAAAAAAAANVATPAQVPEEQAGG